MKMRSNIIRTIRRYLDDQDFTEVETPMMNMVPGRGLHSSTLRLNVSTFCGIPRRMISPRSIRLWDTGRCDRNGLS
jgi:elongation factor P--beta-lysine ligase